MGRKKTNEIKIREWLVLDEQGILCSPFEDSPAFPTLDDAINYLITAKQDARRLPKVERESAGCYIYTPKNQGVNRTHFGAPCTIIRLSRSNVKQYRQMIAEQEGSNAQETP